MTPQQQIILQCMTANVAAAATRNGKQDALDIRDGYRSRVSPTERRSPFLRFLERP